MTDLPIHITAHHLSLSEPLRQFARQKIAPVIRFANDAIGAEIVLRHHGGATSRFSASARLALPGRDIHGKAVHANLYVAIGKLFDKLARLCRKRKTRLAKSFEHPGRSEASSDLAPAPATHKGSESSTPRGFVPSGGQALRVFTSPSVHAWKRASNQSDHAL